MGAGNFKQSEIYLHPSCPLVMSKSQERDWGRSGEGRGQGSGNPGLGDYRSWEERVGMVWGRKSGVRLGRTLFLSLRGQVLRKIYRSVTHLSRQS